MTIDKQKLKALAWFTEDHMTDKSATTYDPAVACRWYEKGWPVQLLYGAETINELLMEISQLKAENEALRKDAKRYRFLRNQHWPVAELAVVCNPKVSVKLGHDCPSGDRLDQQVDGAMIRGASHD
ncbi:hypothetical protein RDI61_14115 [Pseudomonas plecoglossicida]|uniref:hypothetical protein n=1 Tax=Pseudomonas TaxID=286 RepID=UPI00076174CC|nr:MULTISPECIES: hypothetical protein [Pseudomonas]MDD2018988.1 hypothetical protein [Pseudomonas putida]MDQ7965169.1 hypothetical protein [Pseudomonas plecoglossicida]OAS04638.1 hypothetical protein AYO08_14890 [Pseudomonas putida]PEI10783.1 hypothetical protein CRM86_23880 [Pseudomonas putida]WBM44601.1 hypothetical protein M2J85_17850 [Pseudomonas putida]